MQNLLSLSHYKPFIEMQQLAKMHVADKLSAISFNFLLSPFFTFSKDKDNALPPFFAVLKYIGSTEKTIFLECYGAESLEPELLLQAAIYAKPIGNKAAQINAFAERLLHGAQKDGAQTCRPVEKGETFIVIFNGRFASKNDSSLTYNDFSILNLKDAPGTMRQFVTPQTVQTMPKEEPIQTAPNDVQIEEPGDDLPF